MKSDYKDELNKLLQKKKREIPTSFSEVALNVIFILLEDTPVYLTSVAKHFDHKTSLEPIIADKTSFRETLVHLLNIEALNYTTIYPAFLLNKPRVYSIHAERDFDRLGLFINFELNDLLQTFCFERKKL